MARGLAPGLAGPYGHVATIADSEFLIGAQQELALTQDDICVEEVPVYYLSVESFHSSSSVPAECVTTISASESELGRELIGEIGPEVNRLVLTPNTTSSFLSGLQSASARASMPILPVGGPTDVGGVLDQVADPSALSFVGLAGFEEHAAPQLLERLQARLPDHVVVADLGTSRDQVAANVLDRVWLGFLPDSVVVTTIADEMLPFVVAPYARSNIPVIALSGSSAENLEVEAFATRVEWSVRQAAGPPSVSDGAVTSQLPVLDIPSEMESHVELFVPPPWWDGDGYRRWIRAGQAGAESCAFTNQYSVDGVNGLPTVSTRIVAEHPDRCELLVAARIVETPVQRSQFAPAIWTVIGRSIRIPLVAHGWAWSHVDEPARKLPEGFPSQVRPEPTSQVVVEAGVNPKADCLDVSPPPNVTLREKYTWLHWSFLGTRITDWDLNSTSRPLWDDSGCRAGGRRLLDVYNHYLIFDALCIGTPNTRARVWHDTMTQASTGFLPVGQLTVTFNTRHNMGRCWPALDFFEDFGGETFPYY